MAVLTDGLRLIDSIIMLLEVYHIYGKHARTSTIQEVARNYVYLPSPSLASALAPHSQRSLLCLALTRTEELRKSKDFGQAPYNHRKLETAGRCVWL